MHVSLVLVPGCRLLDHALTCDLLDTANRLAGRGLFSHDSRSLTGTPVPSDRGPVLAVSAQGWSGEPGADLVLVLAGADPLALLPMGLRGFLGAAARSGATLGGSGGGVAVLARLGLLNGHAAALPRDLRALAPDGWPLVAPARRDHALDRRRLTATGGLALLDALLGWMALVAGPALSVATAQAMGHGAAALPDLPAANLPDMAGVARAAGVVRVPGAGAGAAPEAAGGSGGTGPLATGSLPAPGLPVLRLPAARDPLLDRMQALMAARLDAPIPITGLCEALDLSPKQLRARCHKLLGRSPAQVYQDLRLARAAHLLRHTGLPVAEVAQAAGFASASSFTRSYRARFGDVPRRSRTSAA